MIDLPATRDLFYPLAPARVSSRAGEGTRVGRDLGADIIVLDSRLVIAVIDRSE
jgi:hypothetical protein